jgi:hypothetical protein
VSAVWFKDGVIGAGPTAVPSLDMCMKHGGKFYGLRVALAGRYSRWRGEPSVSKLDDRRRAAKELLLRTAEATARSLEIPDDVPSSQVPRDIMEVYEQGGGACRMDSVDELPPIGWPRTDGAYGGQGEDREAEMLAAGWVLER